MNDTAVHSCEWDLERHESFGFNNLLWASLDEDFSICHYCVEARDSIFLCRTFVEYSKQCPVSEGYEQPPSTRKKFGTALYFCQWIVGVVWLADMEIVTSSAPPRPIRTHL